MKIHLLELPHQRQALDAILNNFPLIDDIKQSPSYANPILKNAHNQNKFIDIKMETGTGKTYVYTRAMYELHEKFGLYKFIIVVPSLAIKAGTENFIKSDYARQHFGKFFPNKRIELQVISAGDFNSKSKKGKRKNFPATLSQFCDATKTDKNTIQCLLLSDKGFLDRKDSALFRNDYDQTLFNGLTCPVEAIKETLPVLIIDEPHRLKKDGNTYQNIIDKINPQMIMRFGATFPVFKVGKGKSAIEKVDFYQNTPQFDLGAVDSFNQDLVKGVNVDIPQLPESAKERTYKIKSISKTELVFNNGVRIQAGESLSALGTGFQGDVIYESNGKLSNDLELEPGMELVEGLFSNSYQELLLNLALDAHFETEIQNFHRNGYKVKTIALFFIDSIESYRNKQGWLKTTFEKLLKAKLETLLTKYTSGEYHDFLMATKNNLALAHGGYFAKDWGEPDESAIAEEREDILHKERTLSLKKADGTWNIRRFFFSKWTLREGWDNPNVFTICKLRKSGSETSKIQEVGRGLRLPVDEQGNRLQGEWRLNFVIGWDEREFANELVGEINQDSKVILNKQTLTSEMIKIICDNRNITENSLLTQLDKAEIINRANDFQNGGYDKLIVMYPELLQAQLKHGKVTSPTMKEKQRKIKLRTENWQKIKSFWQEVSKRYMLFFERIDTKEINELFYQTLKVKGIFDDNKNINVVIKQTQKTAEGKIDNVEKTITIANPNLIGKLSYSEFVKKLASRTAMPIQIIHTQLWKVLTELSKDGIDKNTINAKLNYNSLEKIINVWCEKFAETFATKYDYNALDFTADTSVMKDGSFVTELSANAVGNFEATDIGEDSRNLYDRPLAYDSEKPEHEILKISPSPKVIVFGKLPRRAIKVPTYTGGSTTPDFVYVVQKGLERNLYVLLETKAKDMRGAEKRAVDAQNKLFKKLKNVKWYLVNTAEEVQKLLASM